MNYFKQTLFTGLLGLVAVSVLGTGCNPDIESGDGGTLSVSPSEIRFNGAKKGETTIQPVTIANDSNGTLVINSIRIEEIEENRDRQTNEFRRGSLWLTEPKTLRANESFEIEIEHVALDNFADSGNLVISVAGDARYNDGIAKFPLESEDIGPQLYTQQVVSFPSVVETSWSCLDIPVQNDGKAPLKISSGVLNDSSKFFDFLVFQTKPSDEDCKGGTPQPYDGKTFSQILQESKDKGGKSNFADVTSIEPQEQFYIRYFFHPSAKQTVDAQLSLRTNLPNEFFSIKLIGNANGPCILIAPTPLKFGTGIINENNEFQAAIKNCNINPGGEALEVTSIEIESPNHSTLNSPIFSIKEDQNLIKTIKTDQKVVLQAGESIPLLLFFNPDSETEFNGTIKFKTNGENATEGVYSVPLHGIGSNVRKPYARPIAYEQNKPNTKQGNSLTVTPQTSVTLDGMTDSQNASTTEITNCQWTLVRPANQQSNLHGFDPQNCKSTIKFNSSGDYVFELVVTDKNGQTSDPVRITVSVKAQTDIHIELTWTTAGTTDQQEHGGDVDLHVAYTKGNTVGYWNDPKTSIYYKNRRLNLSVPGSVMELDLDDKDGAGPENVSVRRAQENDLFAVGVNYFNNKTYGAVYAIVSIFIKGDLKFKTIGVIQPGMLVVGQFWHVANITWKEISGQASPSIVNKSHIYKSLVDANARAKRH